MMHSSANCQLWLGCILHSNANVRLWLGCIGCPLMQTFSCGWVAHDAPKCKLSAVVGLHMTHSKANCQLWLGCILHSNANAWLWLGCIGCTPMQTFSCGWVAHGALQCKLSAVVWLHMMHSNAYFRLGWVAHGALQCKFSSWLGCT